jgi:hypothetical protein
MSFNPNDLNRRASDQRIGNRQTGVPMPTIAGSANGDPDMRKLYCDELQSSMMTTDGPNGMRCGFVTSIIGNGVPMPGDPILKSHTSTSDFGGSVFTNPGNGIGFHVESEMVNHCEHLVPPDGAEFPWVYYHTPGSGFDAGYYYFLDATDGPHPGKGPGWPK